MIACTYISINLGYIYLNVNFKLTVRPLITNHILRKDFVIYTELVIQRLQGTIELFHAFFRIHSILWVGLPTLLDEGVQ